MTTPVSDPALRAPDRLTAAGLAAAGAAAAVLATVDPARTRLIPPCPFRALTGHSCPGCGSTRALHQLLTGDVVAAAGFNVLLVAAVPVVVVAAVMWTGRRMGRLASGPVVLPPAVPWTVLVVVLAFWAVRNIPVEPFSALAP